MEEPVHWDRLSELPESLIHHIFSFLPLKDVVSTTILSKAWVNPWTTAPCLNLIIEDEEEEHDRARKMIERLVKFVNWALILWKGVKILKFKIDVPFLSGLSLDSDVNVWTLFAVNNKVEELEIITYAGELWAPQCLYSCSSLRKLSIVGFNAQITGPPSWTQLKSLKLEVHYGSRFDGDLMNQIMLGSPELEVFELDLVNNYENLNMTSRSLKKLKIKNCLYFINNNPSLGTVIICCPNLETLEISGLVGKCFFADISSSLIDATLDFCTYDRLSPFLYELLGETLKQCFSAIQHVEKVTLSDLAVQVFGASHKKCLHSPLPNVKYLKLDLCHIQPSDMIDLLEILPNLKMLVIKHQIAIKPLDNIVNYMEFESILFKSFLLELKTIEISSSFYDISIFWFIEFLLKHAVRLEKMVLRSIGFMYRRKKLVKISQKKLFEISEKLLSVPRSSPTAKVILKNN